MCDYSLYALPNRLAEDGEEVVLYKFGTGSVGFASVVEAVEAEKNRTSRWQAFCGDLKAMLLPRSCTGIGAVCMPPGTRLGLTTVPDRTQDIHKLHAGDTVVVTEITTQSYAYRDALILPSGKCVLLQDLQLGMQATVLSTALEQVEERRTFHGRQRQAL